MKKIIIDTRKLQTAEKIHEFLSKEMDFPSWYGKNLDALFDCLTEESEEITIVLKGNENFLQGFSSVFHAAAQENPRIHISAE